MKPISGVPELVKKEILKECGGRCSCCGDTPVHLFPVHHSEPRDLTSAESLIGLCEVCGRGGVDLENLYYFKHNPRKGIPIRGEK